jgi:4-hydroxy-tetrahydrodipicolinate synthase
MASQTEIKGIVVPIITPLKPDESVDEFSLRKVVRHVIAGGVHGIFVNSSTGEAMSLLDAEREKAIRIVVEETNRAVPVFVGVSDTSTRRVIHNLEFTNKLDIEAIVVHPYFFYPLNCPSEIINFYNEIAAAAAHPLIVYDIPSTTKIKLSLAVVTELMKNEKIIGIKDSSVDFLNLIELIDLKKFRPDFKIFIGKSHLWTGGILEGADGGLDGLSNLVPDLCVKLYDLIIKQNLSEAYALQHKLNAIWKVYQCRSFLSGIKTAVSLLGLCSNSVTHPNEPASPEEIERIRKILKFHDLI